MLVLLPFALAAQLGRTVQVATYASPSGAYELEIDPSSRDGSGPSIARLQRDSAPVWTASLPFTPLEVAVGETGGAFGYALSKTVLGLGYLHAFVLAPDGRVLADRTQERVASRYPDGAPTPYPLGVVLLEQANACVLRLADPDHNRGLETWWVHRLSTGEHLADVEPGPGLARDTEERWQIEDVRAAGDTGLAIAWGRVVAGSTGFGEPEAQWFALLEASGEAVWTLADDGAFSAVPGLEVYDLLTRLRERQAIVATGLGGRFRVRRPAEGAIVDYRAERFGGGWRVVETGRTPDEDLAREIEPQAVEVERVALERRSSRALQSAHAEDPAVLGPIAAWGFGESDGFVVVRRLERLAYEHVRVDGVGAVIARRRFDLLPDVPGPIAWLHLGGDRWLVTMSPWDEGARSRALLADAESGALRPIEGLDVPSVEALAAGPDGSFALLATYRREYSMESVLIAFDAGGRERWRIDESLSQPTDLATLFAPADVAVLPDGTVATLDNVRHAIQLFDAEGRVRRAIDLAAAWGTKPRYPIGLEPAPDDGLLVLEMDARAPLRLLAPDGSIRRGLRPQRADRAARAEPALQRNARFSSGGELWTSDGHRLYRLDLDGLEEHAVGPPPSVERVEAPGGAAIDALGRVCVQDQKSGILHVWSASGDKLFTATPEPDDFTHTLSLGRVAARSDGAFAVERDGPDYVLFGADGARLGLRTGSEVLAFGPGDRTFVVRDGGVEVRIDDEVTVKAQRLPDRRWMDAADVHAFADGSFAVLSGRAVGTFGPSGEPRETFELPTASDATVAPPGPSVSRVSASERWIALSGHAREIWLIERATGAARLAALSGIDASSTCVAALAPDADELLALDLPALVLHRYSLPAMENR